MIPLILCQHTVPTALRVGLVFWLIYFSIISTYTTSMLYLSSRIMFYYCTALLAYCFTNLLLYQHTVLLMYLLLQYLHTGQLFYQYKEIYNFSMTTQFFLKSHCNKLRQKKINYRKCLFVDSVSTDPFCICTQPSGIYIKVFR